MNSLFCHVHSSAVDGVRGRNRCSSPSGSPYRDKITLGILQLQENNRLEILKRRWWEGGQCPKEEDHRAKGGCGAGGDRVRSIDVLVTPQVSGWRTSGGSSWS